MSPIVAYLSLYDADRVGAAVGADIIRPRTIALRSPMPHAKVKVATQAVAGAYGQVQDLVALPQTPNIVSLTAMLDFAQAARAHTFCITKKYAKSDWGSPVLAALRTTPPDPLKSQGQGRVSESGNICGMAGVLCAVKISGAKITCL